MRISALGLQADLDRHLVDEIGGICVALRQGSAHALHVAFAQVEPHPDRIELDDAGELTRLVAAYQLAHRHLTRRHDAVEWGDHGGVAEVDLRGLRVGLRLLHIGVRGIAIGARLVEVGLGRTSLACNCS